MLVPWAEWMLQTRCRPHLCSRRTQRHTLSWCRTPEPMAKLTFARNTGHSRDVTNRKFDHCGDIKDAKFNAIDVNPSHRNLCYWFIFMGVDALIIHILPWYIHLKIHTRYLNIHRYIYWLGRVNDKSVRAQASHASQIMTYDIDTCHYLAWHLALLG